MRVARSVFGLLAFAFLAACSNAPDNTLDFGTATNPSTTTEAPPTTTPASTTERTTTTLRATTSPPTTTAPESTTTVAAETATTTPDTTTVAPSTPEEQVKADYLSARNAREACSFEPATCDFSAIAVPGSPNDLYVRETIQQSIEQNIRAIPGHGEVKINVESVTISGEVATLVACNRDSIVLFNIGDPATQDDDVVVNDEVSSYRVSWELRLVDGRWLPYEGTNLEQAVDGSDMCGLG